MYIRYRSTIIVTVVFTLNLIVNSISLASAEQSAENITIYSHYEMPPFVTSKEEGLTYELANKLNELSNGKYNFNVEILPRKRLDSVIESEDWRGLVPWVNPVWFNDKNKRRFSWSKVIMRDENLVISHQLKPVVYDGPSSLKNLTLGGIVGHRYVEIEPFVRSKEIKRDDVVTEIQNIEKLLLHRIDVLFMPRISLNYYINKYPRFKQQVFVSEKPRGSFERFFLMPKTADNLKIFINHALPKLTKIEGISDGFPP